MNKNGFIGALSIILAFIVGSVGTTSYFIASRAVSAAISSHDNLIAYYDALGSYEVARGNITINPAPTPLTPANVTINTKSDQIPDPYYGNAGETDEKCLKGTNAQDCNWNFVDRYNSATFYLYNETAIPFNVSTTNTELDILLDNDIIDNLGTNNLTISWKVWDDDPNTPQSASGELPIITTGSLGTLTTATISGTTLNYAIIKLADFNTNIINYSKPVLALTLGSSSSSIQRIKYQLKLNNAGSKFISNHINIDAIGTKDQHKYRIFSQLYKGSLNPLFIYSIVGQ